MVNAEKIFEEAALYGNVADKDGVELALEGLRRGYRAARVPRRDADSVILRLTHSFESGKAHNQAKRGKRIIETFNAMKHLITDTDPEK